MFMLGYAYQLGALPLSAAIERAIEMNGEAVPMEYFSVAAWRAPWWIPRRLEALIEPRPQQQTTLSGCHSIRRT